MERTLLRQDKLDDITTLSLRASLTNGRAIPPVEIRGRIERSIRLTKALLPNMMALDLVRLSLRPLSAANRAITPTS